MFIAAKILWVAALDIKMCDAPTVSLINSLLLQYCKALHFFANFYVLGGGGGAPTVCFAPGGPWAKAGPAHT
jgi:hypothetical protein